MSRMIKIFEYQDKSIRIKEAKAQLENLSEQESDKKNERKE